MKTSYDPNYIHVPTYFLLGVKTVVVNDNDEILILKRSDKSSRAHGWDFPGGAVDKGEDPIEAAIRETKEETGLDISQVRLLSADATSAKESVVTLGYMAYASSSNVQLSWEHEAFRWISAVELKTIDLPSQHIKVLEAYKQRA